MPELAVEVGCGWHWQQGRQRTQRVMSRTRSPIERCLRTPISQRATPSAQVKVKKGTIGEDSCNFMDGAVAGPGSESYEIAIIGHLGAQT